MNVFKEARKRKGLSQKELGEIIHVSQGSISQWEIGKTTPDLKTIIALADLYGVSTDYLLGRTKNPLSIVPCDTPYVEVTPLEKRILDTYRALSEVEQMMICRMLRIEHPAEIRSRAKKT